MIIDWHYFNSWKRFMSPAAGAEKASVGRVRPALKYIDDIVFGHS